VGKEGGIIGRPRLVPTGQHRDRIQHAESLPYRIVCQENASLDGSVIRSNAARITDGATEGLRTGREKLSFCSFSKEIAVEKRARPVIVCTEFKGVFFGYATDTSGDRIYLKNARMAIYWGTTRGVMQLAETGPTPNSKISARADIEVRKITAVFEVKELAVKAWEDAK